MRKAAIITASVIALTGCASPSHFEFRVFYVQNTRYHNPTEEFVGPQPDLAESKMAPGTIEAIAVIARAVSDCFKWGYDAGKYGSKHEVGMSTTTYCLVYCRLGESIELALAQLVTKAYRDFLSRLRQPIPTYDPMNWKDTVQAAGELQGFQDEPSPVSTSERTLLRKGIP